MRERSSVQRAYVRTGRKRLQIRQQRGFSLSLAMLYSRSS